MATDYRKLLGLSPATVSFPGQDENEAPMPMLPAQVNLPGDPADYAPTDDVPNLEGAVKPEINRSPAVMPPEVAPAPVPPALAAPVMSPIQQMAQKTSAKDILDLYNRTLADAQQKRANNQAIALTATGANDVATNAMKMIHGASPIAKPGWIDELKRTEGKDIQELGEKMALPAQVLAEKIAEKSLNSVLDPNTEAGQKALYISLLTKRGIDPSVLATMQLPQFQKMFPDVTKLMSPNEMSEYQKKMLEFQKEKLTAETDLAKEKIGASKDDREEKTAKKIAENDDKDAKALENTLSKGWVARSGQAGNVQGKIIAAEAANQLIDQGRHQPGGLDARQIEELAQATARLLGGSAAASARVDALVPHTWLGRAQTAKEWLANKPAGQEMQAFTERMAETVKREYDLAKQQRTEFQLQSLAAHDRLRKSNPDLFNSILESKGIDPASVDERGLKKKDPESKDQPKSASASPTGDGIDVILPNGKPGRIPKDKLDELLQHGGKLR